MSVSSAGAAAAASRVVNGLIAKLDAFKFGLTEALIDPGAVQDGAAVPAHLTYVSMSSLYAFASRARASSCSMAALPRAAASRR